MKFFSIFVQSLESGFEYSSSLFLLKKN